MTSADPVDVLVVGGGASGLMCASQAAARGRSVLVLEKGPKVGLKILVSGGGRCNFTNLNADPEQHYLSDNARFCLSAMRRYDPYDFLRLVETYGIAYHEKQPGQLFCDHSAKDIARMLLEECASAGARVLVNQQVERIEQTPQGYIAHTANGAFSATKLVLASGGLSLPKIASDLAFRVARTRSVAVVPTRAALVPLTWNSRDRQHMQTLSGVSLPAEVQAGGATFSDDILFTHRGLSGPAILQVSSYWQEGDSVAINLLPELAVGEWLIAQREQRGAQLISRVLKDQLPNRIVEHLVSDWFKDSKLGETGSQALLDLGKRVNDWAFKPGGSEGYRTAEVTLGGIDTNEVSSKTFELRRHPGLYAIGEALDVTGWLGGYNFQWAWASGWCCGQHV